MKFHKNYLKEEGFKVEYISTSDEKNEVRKLILFLAKQNITSIHIADVVDYLLLK